MRGIICLLLLLSSSLAQEDDIEALLLYENPSNLNIQTHGWDEKNVNALTLKKQIHQEIKKFADFTLCFRVNVLSFTDNWLSTPITLRTDKYVEVSNPDTGQTFPWTDFVIILWSNAVAYMCLNTFPDFIYEVIAENGVYTMWPKYEGGCLTANQWHSICLGFDVKVTEANTFFSKEKRFALYLFFLVVCLLPGLELRMFAEKLQSSPPAE